MNYQEFFIHISSIVQSLKEKRQAAKDSGNAFNLFEVLDIEYDEVKHSSFLAGLLDPKGFHGKGNLFLQQFIKLIGKVDSLDYNTVKVETEFTISPISADKKRGGRIDVLITDAKKNAIIIENKLYAPDQINQLLRYDNFGKDMGYNYQILYLTLDGKDASKESTGDKDIKYTRLSYKDDVIRWIEDCQGQINENSWLTNNLEQYVEVLRNLFFMMDQEHENQLIEFASSSENASAYIAIIANQYAISKAIIDRFVTKLKECAEGLGFTVGVDEGFAERAETYISFYIPSHSQNWRVWIGSDKKDASDVYYSIEPIEGHKSIIEKKDYKNIPHLWVDNITSKNYPCGWANLWSETGVKKSGYWYDWYSVEALTAMEDGTMLQFIHDHVLTPVLKSNVLYKLRRF